MKSSSMLARLLAHTSWYTIGSFLATLASFVTFPLLTRSFTVAEYGVLNLIAATLLLLVGLAKSGVQHAVVRFYGEVHAGSSPEQRRRYHATVVYGMAITGLIVTLIWLPVSQVLPDKLWRDPRVAGLLLITASLVLTRSIDSALVNLLRAQERSRAFSVYQVAKKYLLLAGTVVALWVLSGGLTRYYLAMLATETLALAGLAWIGFRGEVWRPRDFDSATYKAMMRFGIPMIGFEMMSIVLNTGARYVISWSAGNASVGIYSAAYNLCEYVETIFIISVQQAIQPIYVRLWKTQGVEETSTFLHRSLHLYLALAAVLVAGVSSIGPEMISLLASDKYLAGDAIIPFIIGGMVLRGSMMIFGAGIYLHMQSKIMALLVAGTAVLNMILNVMLIPRWGIMGAAVSVLLSYIAQAIGVYFVGSRWLRVRIPWLVFAKYAVVGALMYAVVREVSIASVWGTLIAKMLVGASTFAVAALAVDGEARRLSAVSFTRLRAAALGAFNA
jgi:O-antigen/teichoic acid export membrane protein